MDQVFGASDLTAMACNTPGFRDAIFAHGDTCTVGGTTYKAEEIAHLATCAHLQRRNDFPFMCGARAQAEARRQRQFRAAVEGDVKRELGITFLGALLAILGGPLPLILAIVGCVFEFLLQGELTNKFSSSVLDMVARSIA